jgi:hypothetical protein
MVVGQSNSVPEQDERKDDGIDLSSAATLLVCPALELKCGQKRQCKHGRENQEHHRVDGIDGIKGITGHDRKVFWFKNTMGDSGRLAGWTGREDLVVWPDEDPFLSC